MLAPIAYLTCEIKGRDLPSRLLIASHLLKRGYTVVVGQQWSMIVNLAMANAPKGCVLFKTANKIQGGLMANCAAAGHIVFASDEECLPAAVGDYARTTDPSAVDPCHLYLALNALHRDALIGAYPKLRNKTIVTGTARVDVLRSAKTKRPKAEDYILFNTSFGRLNSVWGDTKAAVDMWMDAGGHKPGPEATALVEKRLAFERHTLEATHALIENLIDSTPLDIVIRPHPSERVELWSDRYGAAPRIHIVPRSDPVPWMQHARVMIHNESSTGIEAAIMGARALNFSPIAGWGERLIVDQVNVTARSADEASDLVARLLADGSWPAPARATDTLFPAGGAADTAAVMANPLPPPGPHGIQTWQRIDRPDLWKDKFTVSLEEVRAHIGGCEITVLDDSLFLLTPSV
jgi:surface carbohydrate biosynthesis protein